MQKDEDVGKVSADTLVVICIRPHLAFPFSL